ncbi:MAG TPA: quinone-dependent dihydroorotate dehydrogenase [Candidatus Saccharimonadales bacterium]
MNTLTSALSHTVHVRALKPMLFRMRPDFVHNRTVAMGSAVQRVAPFLGLVRSCWAYQNPDVLGQTLAGIEFTNPIGLSAGFDKKFELLPLMKNLGFGFEEAGSLTFQPCDGNPRPWFYRLPKSKSIVVHAGLANPGVEAIIARVQKYKPAVFADFPLNVSIAKTNSRATATPKKGVADYVGSLQAVKQADIGDLVTLNISCPNAYGGEPFTTPELLEALLTAIDAVGYTKPIFLKMPCAPWDYVEPLVAVASKHNVAGLTFSNLAKDRSSPDVKDPLPDSVRGGLSGKPTWEMSNELIRRTYIEYPDRFIITGVGGVFSAEDAYTKIRLGANLVELITGMIFEGPQLIGQINRDLVRLLKTDGFTHISQAVGVDALRLPTDK